MATVLETYNQRIAGGHLTADAAQAEAVRRLDQVDQMLRNRKPGGWFSKPEQVRGLYMWGGVGRGKSMLMDLFYDTLTTPKKRRVHFHDFMQETHAFINEWKAMDDKARKKTKLGQRSNLDDPIPAAANKIASTAEVLCFDEFQVTDIADAMLLGRLFERVLEHGVVMIATSNRHPDDLYLNGINRQLFLPFIDLLKATHDVFELVSDRDYRLERLQSAPVYYAPLGPEAEAGLDAAWTKLTSGAQPRECHIRVQGREWRVPAQAAGVARMSFDELCNRPLGPADYLALVRQFHTLLISDVPALGPQNRNEAKRFVTLIDALYEAKTKLVMSAEAQPDDLYTSGDGAFEFERTASRLHEMRSADYLAAEREVVVEAE